MSYLTPQGRLQDNPQFPTFGAQREDLSVDTPEQSVTYYGYAVAGVKNADAYWAIARVTRTATLKVTEWADGQTVNNKIWDNRTSYTYA